MATVEWAHVEEEDLAESDVSPDHASLEHCGGNWSSVLVVQLVEHQSRNLVVMATQDNSVFLFT